MSNLSHAELLARIAHLEQEQAELKALKKQLPRMLTVKVKEKGTICVYGLQRFPVSLYANQWEQLLRPEQVEAIMAVVRTQIGKAESA